MKNERNTVTKEISQLKRNKENADAQIAAMKKLGDDIDVSIRKSRLSKRYARHPAHDPQYVPSVGSGRQATTAITRKSASGANRNSSTLNR